MSTKSKNGHVTKDEIDEIFSFSSEKNEIEHEARMIMFRFFSEIERLEGNERGFKKRLAKSIKKSSSFITQLFNGDKLVNLITLAKFQRELDIKFKITAYRTNEFELISSPIGEMAKNIFISHAVTKQKGDYGRLSSILNESGFTQITTKSEVTTG